MSSMDPSSTVKRRRNFSLAPTTETGAGEDGDFVQLRLIREQANVAPNQSESINYLENRHTNRTTSADVYQALFDAIKHRDREKAESLLHSAKKDKEIENIRHQTTGENVLHFALSHDWKDFAKDLINKEGQELLLSNHLIKRSGLHGERNSLHIVTEMNDYELATLILSRIPDKVACLALMKTETALEIEGERPRLFSCLHLAAYYGHTKLVKLFLDKGMSVNFQNGKHDTALLWAARWGHNDTVSLLLDRGADPEVKNDKGSTALYWAIRYQLPETVRLLLTKGKANPNTISKLGLVAPIIIASAYGNKEIVSHLLKCPNIDVNLKIRGGDTAIHNAAREGWKSVVELLVKAGARFDDQDDLGDTPLLLAAKYGHVNVVHALVKAGANICHRNRKGNDIWFFAINNEKNSLLKSLINSNRMTPSSDRNPLCIAASLGKCDKIQFLVDMKYDTNTTDSDGNTFLHHAAANNCSAVIDAFHSLVALDMHNSSGNTALHVACLKGFPNTIKSLLNCKAKVDIKNKKGETALHVAAYSENISPETAKEGHASCVKRLIDIGADISIRDMNGDTVLHRLIKACVHNNKSISRELEVFETIFERIVQWWCLKTNKPFPENSSDIERSYRRQAVLQIINDIKNKEGLSVLNQAFKSGVPEVLNKLLMMPDVTMVEGPSYFFDITGLTPRTNNELKGYCGRSRVEPYNEKLEMEEEEISVSGLELLITNEAANAADILDIPPLKMIEKYYTSLVSWTFALLLAFHIAYMGSFTYLSINLLGKLREDSGQINSSDVQTVLMYILVPLEPTIIIFYYVYSIFRIVLTGDIFRRSKLINKQGLQLLLELIASYVSLDVCSAYSILVFTWIGMFTKRHAYQDYVLAAALCFGWLLSISFTRGIQAIHFFYKTLISTIIRDVIRFIVVYMFVLLAFAFAFHALIQISPDIAAEYSNPAHTLFVTFNIMIGMGELIDDAFETNMAAAERSTTYVKVLYLMYIILATIVLLNLLIAMMNDSYSMILNEKQVRWRIESVNMGVEIESTFPASSMFSKVKINRGALLEAADDELLSDRWYVEMTGAEYVENMQELQKKSVASTDAIIKRLDDLESKMTALMKQSTKKFQQLTDIISIEVTHRRKSERKKRKKSERKVQKNFSS